MTSCGGLISMRNIWKAILLPCPKMHILNVKRGRANSWLYPVSMRASSLPHLSFPTYYSADHELRSLKTSSALMMMISPLRWVLALEFTFPSLHPTTLNWRSLFQAGEVIYLLSECNNTHFMAMNKNFLRGKVPKRVLSVLLAPWLPLTKPTSTSSTILSLCDF